MAQLNDPLNDNLDDAQPTRGTGVKRLNRLPVIFIIAIVVVALGSAIFSIHSVDSQQARAAENGQPSVMRSDNFVDNFIRGRPDGLIAAAGAEEEQVQAAMPPVIEEPEPAPEPPPEQSAPPPDAQVVDRFAERWEQELFQEQLRVAHLLRGDQERALRGSATVDFKRKGGTQQPPSATGNVDRQAAADQRRQQLYQQMGLGGQGSGGGAGADAAMAGLAGGYNGSELGYYAQNNQSSKRDFANSATADNAYLGTYRTPARAALEVKAGAIIPATLITGVNSDLPGQMIAQVSHNVFDTVSGRFVLIPQGAKLIGRYDSSITMGQNRLLVVWDRLIYPDGSSINIKGMQGTDVAGNSGFRDKVNNHYGRIFGQALLLSFVSAAVQLAEDENELSAERQALNESVAQEIGRVSTELIRRGMNIQPTIEIRPGYPFAVMVNKDMILPPYQPMQDYLAKNRSALGQRPSAPLDVEDNDERTR